MNDFNNYNLLIGIGIVIIIYAVIRMFSRRDDSVEREIDEVINSDKYD